MPSYTIPISVTKELYKQQSKKNTMKLGNKQIELHTQKRQIQM